MTKQKPTSSRFFLGISLLILGVIMVFGKRADTLKSTLAGEPVKVEGFSEAKRQENKEPTRIIIPEISIDLIVKRAEIVTGYWQVFIDSAAWGAGSGYPGEPGNQVIFAHAREGLFLPLKSIKKDSKIYILTKGEWYLYKVVEIKEVYPNQVEVVEPTKDETLTLYTCSDFEDSKRLIVIAKRT
ncbi:MAG: sortase [Patescibacteria group bacterium]